MATATPSARVFKIGQKVTFSHNTVTGSGKITDSKETAKGGFWQVTDKEGKQRWMRPKQLAKA